MQIAEWTFGRWVGKEERHARMLGQLANVGCPKEAFVKRVGKIVRYACT